MARVRHGAGGIVRSRHARARWCRWQGTAARWQRCRGRARCGTGLIVAVGLGTGGFGERLDRMCRPGQLPVGRVCSARDESPLGPLPGALPHFLETYGLGRRDFT